MREADLRAFDEKIAAAMSKVKTLRADRKTVVAKLGAEYGRAARQPDVVQKLEQGKLVVGSTPEELRRLVAREVPAWKKIVQETGAKAD